MVPKLNYSYGTFWEVLPLALVIAENRTRAGKAIAAVKRLKDIEVGGNAGYLNNNEPFQALADYVAHVYDGGPAPFWLLSAERG
jgi:hypothetical protein